MRHQSSADNPPDDVISSRLRGNDGYDVTLLSDTQFHVADAGDTLRMECAFRSDAYNLFDYPVIWRKQQLAEWTQINVMGSLNRPFVTTDRFEVTFLSVPPRYMFELTVSGKSCSLITPALPGAVKLKHVILSEAYRMPTEDYTTPAETGKAELMFRNWVAL